MMCLWRELVISFAPLAFTDHFSPLRHCFEYEIFRLHVSVDDASTVDLFKSGQLLYKSEETSTRIEPSLTIWSTIITTVIVEKCFRWPSCTKTVSRLRSSSSIIMMNRLLSLPKKKTWGMPSIRR